MEDSVADAELMLRELRHALEDFTYERVDNLVDLELALTRAPDVVLCDVVMPSLDGRQAVVLIRGRAPDLPIIIVTGELDDREAAEMIAAGANDYLLKDRLGRLGGAIERTLQQKRQRERAARVIAGQNDILKGIAMGASLPSTLEATVRLIESQAGDMVCSILIVDGDVMRHGAAPSLPAEWNAAVDGQPHGPKAGSCGTAVWRGADVIVTDIKRDPLWVDYRDAALAHGLRACWSRPIFATDRKILGTFAMYYTEKRGPTADEVQLVDVAVGLAAVALEQAETSHRMQIAVQALENIADGVMILDDDFHILQVNPAFERILDETEEDVKGTIPDSLQEGGMYPTLGVDIKAALAETGRWQGEIQGRRRGGELFPALLNVSRAAPNRIIVTFSDISVSRDYENRLAFLAQHDALTQLANREQFSARIASAITSARRNRGSVGVMMLDLDNFKQVNDTLGHDAGDRLLRAVAARLRDVVRDDDMVARLGGDEFGILLGDVETPNDCVGLVQRLIESLREPILLRGHEMYVTCSIGISLYPQDGQLVATLLSNADVAMFRAKEQGRDTYQFFSAEMNEHALDTLIIANGLRTALANNEFVLHYQPRFDIRTREMAGLEALIRWNHPDKGLLPPGVFIPIAESTGMIGAIGDWALNEACRQGVVWRDDGHAVSVAVNLSGRQFRSGDLVAQVDKALRDSGLEASALSLEITESMLVGDSAEVAETLKQLSERGLRIAIDDFGTGYSSLSYLKRFPINDLKIDRAFVMGLPDDENDAAIVRAIVAVAQSLGMRTVAEGVETEEQLEYLKALNCDEVQGYLLGKPVAADRVEFS
ncbi:MAG: EAL domain-containing protein [Gammaproteobacteria bacterium]